MQIRFGAEVTRFVRKGYTPSYPRYDELATQLETMQEQGRVIQQVVPLSYYPSGSSLVAFDYLILSDKAK